MASKSPVRENSHPSAPGNPRRRRKPKKNKYLVPALLLVVVLLAASVIWMIANIKKPDETRIDAPETTEALLATERETIEVTPFEAPIREERFGELLKENEDIVGWITLEGTDIDLPVMQTEDNTYYASHDLQRAESEYGVPYLDYDCDLALGGHMIIYGSPTDREGESAFSQLRQYADPKFVTDHPTIRFESLYFDRTYKIVAAYTTTNDTENPGYFPFNEPEFITLDSELVWEAYLKEIKARAIYTVDGFLGVGEEFLTLYTAAPDHDSARFVVVARLVQQGEDTSVKDIEVASNPIVPDFA